MIIITLYSEWIHALCLPPGSLQITQWFVTSPVLALLHLYISVVSMQKYYGILSRQGSVIRLCSCLRLGEQCLRKKEVPCLNIRIYSKITWASL